MKIIKEEITRYAVSDAQMSEWKQICQAYARKYNAKLLFVNKTSFGIETEDGQLQHIYIDELEDFLKGLE